MLKGAVDNENGMALVIVLLFMFILGILGTSILNTSTTELKMSGNHRFRKEAFFATERGQEYAGADALLYATIGTGTVTIPRTGVSLAVGNSNVSGTMGYVSSGNPPRGSGADATQFEGRYYMVDVTGTSSNNASVRVESSIARLFPRP
jgi:Tfp pilus assembly protein PilX